MICLTTVHSNLKSGIREVKGMRVSGMGGGEEEMKVGGEERGGKGDRGEKGEREGQGERGEGNGKGRRGEGEGREWKGRRGEARTGGRGKVVGQAQEDEDVCVRGEGHVNFK